MSGQFTNHSRPLATAASSSRVWNHLTSSQNEDITIDAASLSGVNLNDNVFYSQAASTCPPHLPMPVAHNKNLTNWHGAVPTSNTADSLTKSAAPLFSLQLLVDNKQSHIMNMSEKKDSFDLTPNIDASNTCMKAGPINNICLIPKNVNKVFENENRISSRVITGECTFSDTNTLLSVSSNYCHDSSFNKEKGIVSKLIPVNFENYKTDISSSNHDKFMESNINRSHKILDFSSDVTIEKVVCEKKTSELIRDIEGSSVIMQTKSLFPTVVNLVSKLDKNVESNLKCDPLELCCDSKKKIKDLNVKPSKNLSKKGKKGVDSLLEKLESCNRKCCPDNSGSTALITHVDERDTNSIKSVSPEYYKSRSPNSREDDVVSPCFSNDDSNDTKQRRKRKLGKPIRLAKEVKVDHEDGEFDIIKSKLSEPNKSLLLQSSLFSTYTLKHTTKEEQLQDIQECNVKICSIENQEKEDELIISNFKLKENPIFGNKIIDDKELSDLNSHMQLKETCKTDMSQYLIQSLKDTQCIRTRRCSDCPMNVKNKNPMRRRKSCDDVRQLQTESVPKISISNNIVVFNEVESQLEKMFAGIIENDKDMLKKTIFESEKSVTLLSDDDQKENLKKSCDVYKNKKQKNISKIRSHKKKSDSSTNVLRKDKKGPFGCKRSLTKSSALKKKKNIKIDSFQEIIYDSLINANTTKSRGPVIQIRGSKNSPIYVQIINAPREDDEEKCKEKRKSISNGTLGRSKRLNYQNSLDYRGKVGNVGLFNSTLSVRYDAHTADITWICVFCKRGPHFIVPGDLTRPHPNVSGPHIIPGSYTVPAGVLSDLFGPYLIGKDFVEDNVMSPDEKEITKEQKQGSKNKRSLRFAGLTDQFLAKVGKTKRKFSNNISNIYTGMTMLSSDEQRWEVWLHEQCIMWAAGVYITGGRISGLQEAVWDAIKSICDSCGLSGANIGCIVQGCTSVTHYCCALTGGWYLDIEQYIPKCSIHRIT